MKKNNLDKIWNKLSQESFIYTKHNCKDVYNSVETLKRLKKRSFNKYLSEEEINEDTFYNIYKISSQNDKKLIDNEIELLLKNDLDYKKFISNKNKINKYKSKAFEILTQNIFNKLFYNLYGEDSFKTILDKLKYEITENPINYRRVNQEFKVYNFDSNKSNLKMFNLKNLTIGFKKNNLLDLKKHYLDGDFINISELDNDKKYIFEITEKNPVLRISRGINIIFYKENHNNDIKYKKVEGFDELHKQLNNEISDNGESFNNVNHYLIISTFKDFLINYYVKSEFLKSLEKLNKSHISNRINKTFSPFPNYRRPDMWRVEDGKIVFFEVKFNEFTNLKLENLQTTLFYVKEFNRICKLNNLDLRVKDINLIHINNLISDDILKAIEKYKSNGYNFNLINIKKIIKDSEEFLPSRIVVNKTNNGTVRILENNINDKNIIIDLTKVT